MLKVKLCNKTLWVNKERLQNLSTKEQDILLRSNQKLKDNLEVNSNSENNRPQSPKVKKVKGYKDHLVGLIPRAYQKVFFEEKN